MSPIISKLAARGLTLVGVLFIVLILVVITLGATGFSDRMLEATVSEDLRGLRQSLSETIRDPVALEEVLQQRHQELITGLELACDRGKLPALTEHRDINGNGSHRAHVWCGTGFRDVSRGTAFWMSWPSVVNYLK